VAQTTAEPGGGDTAIIVPVITAIGVVLGTLITVLGQRNTARLDAIEKNQSAFSAAIERLERRLEAGAKPQRAKNPDDHIGALRGVKTSAALPRGPEPA
jgi:outer membrane murein-binding lipoprotein Lpp